MTLIETLRLIAARSPNISGEAARAIRAVARPDSRPIQGALERALADPAASWTVAERAAIAAHLAPGRGAARDQDIRVRVNADEKQRVEALADAAGLSVSDLIRDRLGLL